ncbi:MULTISPECIES: sulfite oxidase heme-binding subunit YedZ [unclassified Campylobacter]|uniref:sulfite oxidase heme-binding subunit YedZ n=1 Tax=unclassified Campylobacter TaxID=2593542 RepID=UPI001237FDBE|nr:MULTISPECIES: sulfite oxidase heme-binding subunit YedZ [unclassified Campylobacter]KAA6225912.1 sulfite oxidase heme-binding subunit YedZ [Campylobacter sp. LR196d]KAA6226521.1 sulfite oxidase heme-binding subunit YedZ [Campylobacter sp. LR286c]KAA6226993.1 sulfite oxidase heme-binding subunit YedZ [Campylobacter sp. LR185c]KAA6230024.1 sulfite oxidase heme-binding subunit YedZ [Campylobacter sp. LR264d]KAA6233442.1 sulfite oxidase heme-binding subunit YedZ [Campylobacter sp. LR291e]
MKIILYLIFILSIIYCVFELKQSFDFVKDIYFLSGVFSLIFLFLSLFFAIFRLVKKVNLAKFFGFFSVFYAICHFLNYFVFEKNLSILRVYDDLTLRQLSGLIALVIMLLMLISSFKFGSKLAILRKLGFVALIMASLHYFLAAKSPNIPQFSVLFLAFLISLVYLIKRLKFKN